MCATVGASTTFPTFARNQNTVDALKKETHHLPPMKTSISTRLFATTAASVVALGLFCPLAVQARDRSGETTGPRGGVLDRDVTSADGTTDVTDTYTGPNGKVTTRTAARTYNPATGRATTS